MEGKGIMLEYCKLQKIINLNMIICFLLLFFLLQMLMNVPMIQSRVLTECALTPLGLSSVLAMTDILKTEQELLVLVC